jgi:hypothetical protein
MNRLARIRKLYRERPRPFRALKRWARDRKGPRGKERRWRSLQKWARKRKAQVRAALRPAWERRRRHYRDRKAFFKAQADKAAEQVADGLAQFDGKLVTADWAKLLARVRATGHWGGSVTSGYRSPEYSEQLCYAICGAPSCPGTCAGRASNHSKRSIAEGAAVDVSDPVGFRRGLVAVGRSDIHNALGSADPWHFSVSGR